MVCKRCGGTCAPNDVFCPFCGNRLDPPSAGQTATRPAPARAETQAPRQQAPSYPPAQSSQPRQQAPGYPPAQSSQPRQQAPSYPPAQSVQPRQQPAAPTGNTYNQTFVQQTVIPPEYRPLSPWAYFGFNLLFAIPVVGLVLLIVFACGGASNRNLRNYARSFFCALLIVVILTAILVVIALATGVTLDQLSRF